MPLDPMERRNACVPSLVTEISFLPWCINPMFFSSSRIDRIRERCKVNDINLDLFD